MKIIYCAGEEGRVVLDSLRRGGSPNEELAFLDDDESLWNTDVDGIEVLGGSEMIPDLESDDTAIVAFGDEQGTRLHLAERCRDHGLELFSVVDQASTVAETTVIGDGVILNAQSYVGPGAALEDLVLVDSAVSIAHDVTLERGATVAPGATIAGGVSVGRDAFVGPGATLTEDVQVGDGVVVGAGAVVLEDVPADETVVGVPAEAVRPE